MHDIVAQILLYIDQYSDLGDTIAYLVATLLGTCDYPCHLHKHAFAPEQLLGTFIPGTMVVLLIYCYILSSVFYSDMTILLGVRYFITSVFI